MILLRIAQIIIFIAFLLNLFTNWHLVIYYLLGLGIVLYLSPLFVAYEKWVCEFMEDYFNQ